MWRTHTNSSESPVAASRSLITVVPIQKPLYWKWNALRGRTFELWEFYLSRKKWLKRWVCFLVSAYWPPRHIMWPRSLCSSPLVHGAGSWFSQLLSNHLNPTELSQFFPSFYPLLAQIKALFFVVVELSGTRRPSASLRPPPPPSTLKAAINTHMFIGAFASSVESKIGLSTCVQLPQSVPRGPRINWSCLKLFPFICFYSFYDYYYCYYYYIFQGPFSFLAFTPFCFLHTIRSGVFFFLLFFSFMLCKTSRVRDWLCFRRRRSREQKSEADLSRPFLQKLLWKRKK